MDWLILFSNNTIREPYSQTTQFVNHALLQAEKEKNNKQSFHYANIGFGIAPIIESCFDGLGSSAVCFLMALACLQLRRHDTYSLRLVWIRQQTCPLAPIPERLVSVKVRLALVMLLPKTTSSEYMLHLQYLFSHPSFFLLWEEIGQALPILSLMNPLLQVSLPFLPHALHPVILFFTFSLITAHFFPLGRYDQHSGLFSTLMQGILQH